MTQFRYQDFVDEMTTGEAGGVFIDDTGSPGMTEPPKHLHPDRKTWVAVIVPRQQVPEVWRQFPGSLRELERITGAREFHFADIYGRHGAFKDVAPAKRVGIFEFFAYLFTTYRFPILVQTFDPSIASSMAALGPLPERLWPLELANHEHLAFLFLLWRLRRYLRDTLPKQEMRVFVDEGLLKNGAALQLPGFKPEFRDGLVCFADSRLMVPLQLADFAAFGLNRIQQLAGKACLSPGDRRLLEIYSPVTRNYVNIDGMTVDLDDWHPPMS